MKQTTKAFVFLAVAGPLAIAATIWNASTAEANQADAVRATAAERCRMLADYAQDVAEMRDLGFRLSDVKEINAEKYQNNILDAHNMAAEMTYQHGDLPPAQVREGLLSGCMTAVNQEASRRAQ
jgi:hypothetical protein